MSHARVLSKIDDREKIDEFVNLILNDNINVRKMEELARDEVVEKVHKIKRKSNDNEYTYLEDELSEMILRGEIQDGQTVQIDVENNELKFEVK